MVKHLAVLGLTCFAVGCASAPSQPVRRSRPAPVSAPPPAQPAVSTPTETPASLSKEGKDKDQMAYGEILALYNSGRFQQALELVKVFEANYSQSSFISQALNIHGLILLADRMPLQAQHQFKQALQSNTDRKFRYYLLYNSAAALAETESYADALSSLSEIQPEALDTTTRIKIHYLKAQLLHRRGASLAATRELIQGIQQIQNPNDPNIGLYQTQMDASLAKVDDYAALEALSRDNKSDLLAPALLLRLAAVAAKVRPALAEAHIRTLQSKYPDSSQAHQAKEILRSTQKVEVSGRAIGVLLPLTGKFSKVGSQARQGIELAFEKNSNLVFEDCGETPEQALTALETLVNDKGVVAVIGPLLSKGIDQITARAQELGVPIISLAQQPGKQGDLIFQASLTARQQATEIAKYAFNELEARRFAILYPAGRFGDEYSQAFWDAVEELGGEVVGFEAYPPKETDFKQSIDRLSGLFYMEARNREVNELARLRKENQITKRTRKTEDYFRLRPVVDYDAVFIPDEAKVIGQILPTFPYRDVERVYFLGTSTWNSPTLADRIGGQSEWSFFVDGYLANAGNAETNRFNNRYRTNYESAPGAIEAISYDAASVVASIMKEKVGDVSRNEMKELLTQTKNFPGVTGRISVQNGLFLRPLKILTVNRSTIVEAKTVRK